MERRLLLNVVVRQRATIFELFSCEDQALLIGGNALLVLDLCLDIVDSVRGFDIQSDRLAGEGLDEDLHSTTKAQDKMERRLLLNVVVRQRATIFELLACKDQALLIRGDALLVLDLCLDIVDGVKGFNIQSDRLAGEGLDE